MYPDSDDTLSWRSSMLLRDRMIRLFFSRLALRAMRLNADADGVELLLGILVRSWYDLSDMWIFHVATELNDESAA